MKKCWKSGTIVCLALVGACFAAPGPAGADDQEQDVRVEVRVEAGEDGDASAAAGAIKKRVIAMAIHAHDGLDEKIEEILKEAGLEGDTLKEAIDKVRKACKESCGAGMNAIREIEMPQVIVIGPDGKQQKIALRSFGGGAAVAGGATHQELTQKIRDKVKEALEKSGLDDKQRQKVHEALEHIGQIQLPQVQMLQPHTVRVDATKVLGDNKYMIGLSCAPLNDELRSELKLADGLGLVVIKAFENTPAAEAGIKDGDVLVKVGGKDVADIEDLIGAVQAAGKDKKKVAVQLLRDGKKQTVQVVPVERDSLEISVEAEIDDTALESLRENLPDAVKHGVFLWKQGPAGIGELGPGVIASGSVFQMDDTAVKELKKQVETLNRKVKQLQAEIKKLKADKE